MALFLCMVTGSVAGLHTDEIKAVGSGLLGNDAWALKPGTVFASMRCQTSREAPPGQAFVARPRRPMRRWASTHRTRRGCCKAAQRGPWVQPLWKVVAMTCRSRCGGSAEIEMLEATIFAMDHDEGQIHLVVLNQRIAIHLQLRHSPRPPAVPVNVHEHRVVRTAVDAMTRRLDG